MISSSLVPPSLFLDRAAVTKVALTTSFVLECCYLNPWNGWLQNEFGGSAQILLS